MSRNHSPSARMREVQSPIIISQSRSQFPEGRNEIDYQPCLGTRLGAVLDDGQVYYCYKLYNHGWTLAYQTNYLIPRLLPASVACMQVQNWGGDWE